MTSFNDREKAFESKYAHDQEMQFKAEARRNKLLGLWAAELFGLSGTEAEAYAKSVIIADFEEAGDDDVFRKVSADFAERGVAIEAAALRSKMKEFMAKAKDQILNEVKG